MERHFFSLLNTIYIDVYGKPVNTPIYNRFIRQLRLDSSNASLSRIRETLIKERDKSLNHILSCHQRESIIMIDNSIKTKALNMNIINNYKVLVLSLCKDIGKNHQYLFTTFKNLSNVFSKCCLYFLTNNNTDNTRDILYDWCKDYENISGTYYPDEEYDKTEKYIYIAKLRNTLLEHAKEFFGIDFDYILVMDPIFNNTIDTHKILSCFSLDEPWDIICGNRQFAKSDYHYDCISLRLIDDSDEITEKFPYFEDFNGNSLHWQDKFYIFDSFYKIKSGFGGIMLLSNKIFALNDPWNTGETTNCTEHISLCQKFRNVYLNPQMSYQTNINMDGILYPNPYLFIPRDSGFFSAFNYLMGMICEGYKMYPYFNLDKIIEKNGRLEHFYYVDKNNDNSWFEYFQPIKYYETDKTHENKEFLLFNHSTGELASSEFTTPYQTNILYESPHFEEWRRRVNIYYKKYFKPSERVLNRIKNMYIDFSRELIGVLVRHPAHACEAGEIYFQDYFDNIDLLLEQNPNALIYLVADTELAVSAFQNKYGYKVLYDKHAGRASFDNILKWAYARSKGGINSIGMINNIGYEYHMEQARKMERDPIDMGIDIVSNTICLSKCKWFIYIPSNISLAVSYMNPDIDMIPVKAA